jgi:erythromycin esterase-like protein
VVVGGLDDQVSITSHYAQSALPRLVWYLERLPADSRVVIWTATMHAARQRDPLSAAPLGARVVERWGDRVGTIGFTANVEAAPVKLLIQP